MRKIKKTLSKSAMKQNTKNSRYKILGTYDSEGNKYIDSLTWEEIDAIPSIDIKKSRLSAGFLQKDIKNKEK